jgi:hypothetical protein
VEGHDCWNWQAISKREIGWKWVLQQVLRELLCRSGCQVGQTGRCLPATTILNADSYSNAHCGPAWRQLGRHRSLLCKQEPPLPAVRRVAAPHWRHWRPGGCLAVAPGLLGLPLFQCSFE